MLIIIQTKQDFASSPNTAAAHRQEKRSGCRFFPEAIGIDREEKDAWGGGTDRIIRIF
jgi:hypothetical protein